MNNNHPTLIFIPTFNEAENVERMCRQLTLLELEADILFCDDNSPDGTRKAFATRTRKATARC